MTPRPVPRWQRDVLWTARREGVQYTKVMKCHGCHRYRPSNRWHCLRCANAREPYWRAQRRAILEVTLAVKAGVIPPARYFRCEDCGAQARHYDHRDYSKPLAVDPVCAACNFRRGPAVQLAYFRGLYA